MLESDSDELDIGDESMSGANYIRDRSNTHFNNTLAFNSKDLAWFKDLGDQPYEEDKSISEN